MTLDRSNSVNNFDVKKSQVKVSGNQNVKIILAPIFVKIESIHVKPR